MTDTELVRMPEERITLQVIAQRLDVSTATVSLALRDSPVVAEATRLRVQKTARELGYVYNRSAASLRTARTDILAVVFHDITNPYFMELLGAIEDQATLRGRSILLGTYAENFDRQMRVLGTLREYRPDGMIICAAGGSTPATFAPFINAGIPIVQMMRSVEGLNADFVGSDDAAGTALAMQHLLALGHRRIAMIGGNDQISTGRFRRQAYRDALAGAGLPADPTLIVDGYGTREMGDIGIGQLLDLSEPPTAAVCFNDLAAFGAMLGLSRRGLQAGRDFSLVGCDDVKEAAQWFPALTTLNNRQREIGAQAADLLIERCMGLAGPARSIRLKPELVVRGTTAPLTR
jgi:LacI family transcriptional regulator